jgi:predicted DNA-binding protein with PD1-like motif
MATHARQVNPAGTRVFMGTITESADIHASLISAAKAFGIETATFELLGGVEHVELAAYDFRKQERLPALIFEGAFEIIAGHGTISLLENAPHVHLHLTLSYRAGESIKLIGGHCAKALAYAVEFTLWAYDGNPVHRGEDAVTKLNLWQLPKLEG